MTLKDKILEISKDENAVIYCETEELAKELLVIADSLGLKWRSGESYLSVEHMFDEEYKWYDLSDGTRCSLGYVKEDRYTIHNFKELKEQYNKFTLDNVDKGMYAILRNGDILYFLTKYLAYYDEKQFTTKDYFYNDFSNKSDYKLEIMKVYFGSELKYERKETPVLTKFEKRLLRELDIRYKTIKRITTGVNIYHDFGLLELEAVFPNHFKTLEPDKVYLIEDLLK